jgi:SSS family solute:Na+ symporter
MAALMSSLDSGLNSLSAVTIIDFYKKYVKPAETDRHYLIASKICTFCWGVFCVSVALLFSQCSAATRDTTIVLINKVGSLLYGPILAAFVLGMLTQWATARGIKTGILTGILLNIFLWLGTEISWLWWNIFGFLSAVACCFFFSYQGSQSQKIFGSFQGNVLPSKIPTTDRWTFVYVMIGIYFFLIIVFCYIIQNHL